MTILPRFLGWSLDGGESNGDDNGGTDHGFLYRLD